MAVVVYFKSVSVAFHAVSEHFELFFCYDWEEVNRLSFEKLWAHFQLTHPDLIIYIAIK